MYIGILRSRTISDNLVQQFQLQKIYSTKTTGDARLKLLDRASFALGKDSMLRLSVEDRDPKRAAALANAFIAELNKQNNQLAITESAQRRLFFEREVAAEKEAMAAAEGGLKQIQQKTGVFEVSSQAQVSSLLLPGCGRKSSSRKLRFSASRWGLRLLIPKSPNSRRS